METDLLPEHDIPEHDIIVIGAAPGGVEAVPKLARNLPGDLAAAVFIALPAAPHIPHLLTAILNKVAALPARQAVHGEQVERSRIYVAPPDHHLKIEQNHVHLDQGPKENRHRPAIDALFRSAAVTAGPRVIGVLLNGSLNDGPAGLNAVKENGGITIVQDPSEALVPEMPEHALRNLPVDYCLPVSEMGAVLTNLTENKALLV